MVKKIITLVLLAGFLTGVYFISKNYYYDNIYNYKKVVNDSIEEYFKTNDSTTLEPTGNLFDLYEKSEDKLGKIREYVYNDFQDYNIYLKEKYKCLIDHLNECILYKEELNNLSHKYDTVYSYRPSHLVSEKKFNYLKNEIKKEIEETEEIIANESARNQPNYDQEREDICRKVTANQCKCDNRSRSCDCTYKIGTSIIKNVRCKNIYTEEESKK